MKVLWLTNVKLPEVSELLGENPTPFGGWLINTSKRISEQDGLELAVASPYNSTKSLSTIYGKNIRYYLFPENTNSYDKKKYNLKNFKNILDDFMPNIVHVFGTEYSHTLDMIDACESNNIHNVISIQGLTTMISRHYMSNLPISVRYRYTFRDLIRRDNLVHQQKKFTQRGKSEIEALKKVENIIGRTTWDKSCSYFINPDAKYYHCNETLRSMFYQQKWDYNNCEKFSIFISQAAYPIKGAHYLLEAIEMVKDKYPETILYIAGNDIINSDSLYKIMKRTSYGKYLKKLIKKYELQNKVIFTGVLSEDEMVNRFLKSNLFICSSSIENSPNSLGEAMILGVPSIASYVGGIPDMLRDNVEGYLYQHDDPYMLAYYICQVFKNIELSLEFSRNARTHALETHDADINTTRLIQIYTEITSKK